MLYSLRRPRRAQVSAAGVGSKAPAEDADAAILHLVGVVTEEVFGLLEGVTSAMSELGVPQTIILLEDPRYAHLSNHFHPLIEVVTVPAAGVLRLRAWNRMLKVFRSLVSEERFTAVHLHGFLPCLLGGYTIASQNFSARVLYSPHASRSLGSARPVGIAARRLLSEKCALAKQVSIASSSSEARSLRTVMARPVEVVENGIGLSFFETVRNEARRPLIAAAGRRDDPDGVEVFSRAAVLLGSADLRLSFTWCGPTEPPAQGLLYAANVGVYDFVTNADLATHLSLAWVFVYPSKRRGFPFHVAGAMAVGVPCVVSDSESHRDIIEHGTTGFIYENDVELVRYIAQLIDDEDLRARVGSAARSEAERRFGAERFRTSLSRVYGVDRAPCDASGN